MNPRVPNHPEASPRAVPAAVALSPAMKLAEKLPDESHGILSTLNDDGSRRWLTPKPSPGRFLSARRLVAYALIAIFALMPLVHLNGHPLILLDITARRFHILGATFLPTDTLLLALLLVGVFLTIFWLTALLGRVWCGWACPQTVYMEFLYRPIERLLEGTPGRARKGWLQTSGAGKVLKYPIYLAASVLLAHTFLAYFVSWDQLRTWVFGSPIAHPIGFAVVAIVTAGMLFDFGYFREQVCLVACPYGRFQSVMLDRHSMTIRYDDARGEPRGKKSTRVSLPILSDAESESSKARVGDCIDCKMCVTTCPTGIDIRSGLQMECIGCAQCIDACDAVMDKIARPRGLIRYSSKASMEGEPFRILRPRVVLYPAILLLIATLFTLVLLNTGVADVTVLRGLGLPFRATPDGQVENNVRVKITNRTEKPATFSLAISGVPGATIKAETPTISVAPGQMITVPAQVFTPRASFSFGRAASTITISADNQFTRSLPFTLLGPSGEAPKEDRHDEHHAEEHHE